MLDNHANMSLAFFAKTHGISSLTWGQTFIWRIIRTLSPYDAHINMTSTMDVSGVNNIESISHVVKSLVEDFEILRTTFPLDEFAKPIQTVHRSGNIAIKLLSCEKEDDVGRMAYQFSNEMQNERFDIENGPVCRFGVISLNEVPKSLAITVSHITMDGLGFRQLITELKERLGLLPVRTGPARSSWQPSSQVRLEQSEQGYKDARESMEFWRDQLCKAPMQSKRDTPFRPMPQRYWHGRLESAALDQAAAVLASRLHISVGSVLLGTLACLLGYVSGEGNPMVIMRVSNRFDAHDDFVIGHLSQDVPVVVNVENPSYSEVLVNSQEIAFEAYQYARYDPDDLVKLVSNIEEEKGTKVDRGNAFNCMKSALASNTDSDEHIDDLGELRKFTKFSWIDKRNVESFKIFVYASQDQGISVFADTQFLPPAKIRAFAYAFEGVLIDASGGEDRLPILFERSGLLPNPQCQ